MCVCGGVKGHGEVPAGWGLSSVGARWVAPKVFVPGAQYRSVSELRGLISELCTSGTPRFCHTAALPDPGVGEQSVAHPLGLFRNPWWDLTKDLTEARWQSGRNWPEGPLTAL